MFISDLNFLQTTEENVAGGGRRGTVIRKDVKRNVNIRLNVDKNVDVDVDIKGNLADAEAVADAYGFNSLTETYTQTKATFFSSSSYSDSLSAVD